MAGALGKASDILPASRALSARSSRWIFGRRRPTLAANLGKATPKFARAIMTTDAFQDFAPRSLPSGGVVKLVGMAKGAGMKAICPNMATMLSVVLCDAQAEASVWQTMLRDAVDLTFNRATVDGDTSTNDTLYGLARRIRRVHVRRGIDQGCRPLTSVLGDLAYMLVRTARASKVARIHVTGAASDAAPSAWPDVGHSQLVKTALYGRDATGAHRRRRGPQAGGLQPRRCGGDPVRRGVDRKGQPTDLDFDALLQEPPQAARSLSIDIVLVPVPAAIRCSLPTSGMVCERQRRLPQLERVLFQMM